MNTSSYGGEWSLQLNLTAHTHSDRVWQKGWPQREQCFPCLCSHGAFIHWCVSETLETVLSPNLMPCVEKDCHQD